MSQYDELNKRLCRRQKNRTVENLRWFVEDFTNFFLSGISFGGLY